MRRARVHQQWDVRRLVLALAAWACVLDCRAQPASNWRAFKLGDGLPESACISVTVSPQRKVLVRHLSVPSVTELDGYSATVIPSPEAGKSRVYQSPGGQLWTVVPGGLQEFREGNWISHRVEELAAGKESGAKVIDPVPLQPIRQGLVLFLQPDGLMEFSAENPDKPRTRLLRAASETGLGKFSGMSQAKDGGLWISCARGLAHIPGPLRAIKPDTAWQEYIAPEDLGLVNFQAPQEDRPKQAQNDDSFLVTALAEAPASQSKVVVTFNGQKWQFLKPGEHRIRQAWRGPEKTLWGMSINALFKWEDDGELKEVDEVSARQYFDVAVEPGGAFWLATSEGLFRYAPLLWSCPAALRQIVAPVLCATSDRDGTLWFCTPARLHRFGGGLLRDFPLPSGAGRLQPRQLYALNSRSVVLAMEDPEAPGADHLFRIGPAGAVPVPLQDSTHQLRAIGMLKDGTLCVQELADAQHAGAIGIAAYNGRTFTTLSDSLPQSAVGTNLYSALTAANGDLWVGGGQGVACLHEKNWRVFNPAERPAPEEGYYLAELPDGTIWSASRDQIWEFEGHNWTSLRRGFDRINGLQRSRDGSIWVASNSGLHRFYRGAWVEHGIEEGLPANPVREVIETSTALWAATTKGLSLFHPEADPETDPPHTTITKIAGEDQSSRNGGPVTINFTGRDKWNQTLRERLLYSYRLDDREWTPFQEADHAALTDLGSGKHYFQVRAMDRNSNVDPSPAQMEFSIVLPWYKETRLLLIALAGAAAALFFGALALNKHVQLLRSYSAVELKVAERTRQLEIANRELLHSQKMNALGTLAAGIAHDFNNILSIIKGSAQIIEDNLENPEKIRTRAERISTVVEQGAGIVKAMLGFSRESGPEPEVCEINAIVQDTLRLLGDRFLREVEVSFQPAAGLPVIATSRDFIQQILLNFIFNAAESMPARKQVSVSTALLAELPHELALAPGAAKQYISVSVQDSGCGIPPENLSRIFEPFFTTKALSARRGTGLGLTMVYELASKLGAGLAVRSVVNQGSTFILILPLRDIPSKSGTSAAPDKTPKHALPV